MTSGLRRSAPPSASPHNVINRSELLRFCWCSGYSCATVKSKRRKGMAQIMGGAGPKSFFVLLCTARRWPGEGVRQCTSAGASDSRTCDMPVGARCSLPGAQPPTAACGGTPPRWEEVCF